MTPNPLITAPELRALLAQGADLVVLDTGFDLADAALGERQYREAHLPGARYAHLETDLSGPKTGPDGRFRGRHPLPERDAFARALGRWGVTPATRLVAYDRQGSMVAARAWWLLQWMGHDAVQVLDGGFAAWAADGGATESGDAVPHAAAVDYPARDPLVTTIEADALAATLGRRPLVDARAPERYRGDTEPLDAQAGHIPGARNRFFKLNLDEAGRFKPASVLRAEWAELLGADAITSVVHQCGSGVTACHNILAMAVAGIGGSVLYPGSWSEWSGDPRRPVARA